MLIQIRTLGKGRMDSEKERVAKWRAAKKLRRDETREAENKRPFSSLFTVTDEDSRSARELEEYLVRTHLEKGQASKRLSRTELQLAIASWSLEELGQLWALRETKLSRLEDSALLLAHIRFKAGIDSSLKAAGELMNHEAVQALAGILDEAGDTPESRPGVARQDAFDADAAVVSQGKRIEQVRRVIRDGQADFRRRLVAHYGAVCMVTGTDVAGVVDAAHIVPYRGATTNGIGNGLLLRKDIHALFDAGLLSIGPDLVVYVASAVEDSYYRSLDGKPLKLAASSKISKVALRQRTSDGGSGDITGEA